MISKEIKTNKTYSNEEIFETLKRETGFEGMFLEMPFFRRIFGGSAVIHIPSHKKQLFGLDLPSAWEWEYYNIEVSANANKGTINIAHVGISSKKDTAEADYYTAHKNYDKELFDKVVDECARLFS